jgi:hypothetical protein
MKRMQSVQVVNSRIKGMLPMGCGFGDLCGSVNEICEPQGMFSKFVRGPPAGAIVVNFEPYVGGE